MSTLKFVNLNKVYDNGVHAVYDFNLEIKDKEFVVFVGPSGCGKSTTLRMVAGLEDISSGELYIDDVKVNDVAPKKRGIAMVFQSYALYPHMTVYQNMAFALRLSRLSKQEINEKILSAAKILGLEDYLKRKPKELSGGQKQRVALGRAIVRNPKVFLMDEPLSNLDAKLRVQMRTEITKIHEQVGATTIYVTHDQTEAMTMADRIVIMKDGWIQQIGTPTEVYSNPNNVFVATFIGAPSMNILKGKYKDGVVTLGKNIKVTIPTKLKTKHRKYYINLKPLLEEKLAKLKIEFDEISELVKNDFKYKHAKTEEAKKAYFDADKDIIDIRQEMLDLQKQIENCELAIAKKEHDIILGIRPEDINVFINKENEEYNKPIEITYDVSELLGKELIIYSTLDNQKLIINTGEVNKNIDFDHLKASFKKDKIYLFDYLNQESINNFKE